VPTPWLKIDPDGGDPISAELAPLRAVLRILRSGLVVTVDVSEIPADELGRAAPEDLPFDELTHSLWVGDDDLVRRMTSDLGGYGTTDTTIFGYGEPVEIEAPPADQVTDAVVGPHWAL
jgi:hypothetical protein